MAVREGKWKCEFCGGVNLGRDMKCTACGAVRGEHVEFFLDEDAQEVTDEGLKNIAEGGADWHCDYCGTDNRADAPVCKQCAAPREGMKSREESIVAGSGSGSAGGGSGSLSSPPPMPEARRSPLKFILMGVAAVIVVLAAVFIFGGREDVLVLDDGSWSRSIGIERQEWVEYTVWEDEVPSDALVLDYWTEERGTERVQVGTEKVKVGTKDKGNGFFEDVFEEQPVYEEQAVYDTKVRYEIEEWLEYRNVRASGGLEDSVSWPDTGLSSGDREGQRTESAELLFHSTDPEQEGEVFTYAKLSPDEMSSFVKGSEYKAEVFGNTVRKFLDE